MNKDEFLKELAYLLSDLPDEESREAIEYYRDYIEDAGSEHEDEVLSQLGDPARVAALIRAGMNGSEAGEYTEHGYEDPRYREPGGEVVQTRRRAKERSSYQASAGTNRKKYQEPGGRQSGERRGLKIALIVILVFLASPMLFGVGSGLFGLIMGFFGLLVGLVFGLGGLTLGFLVGGIACLVVGIVRVCSLAPFSGIAAIGGGVALLGVGGLFLTLCVLFYGRFLPWLFRSIAGIFRGLFRGFRKGGNGQ